VSETKVCAWAWSSVWGGGNSSDDGATMLGSSVVLIGAGPMDWPAGSAALSEVAALGIDEVVMGTELVIMGGASLLMGEV